MSGYALIDNQTDLNEVLKKLKRVKQIAIDTESSGFYTYFSALCLIQVSAEGQHYIIDPLVKDINLDEFGEICANEKIIKIFHSAYSDMLELKRAYNWNFKNIFDTFLACRFLGHATCSLSSLVSEYEGVEMEKKEQKSNWQKRPLSKSQLDYAHLDTLYLESLMSKLKEKLDFYGVYNEVKEEFERLCDFEIEEKKEDNSEGWRRIPDVQNLSIEEQAMIRELYTLRDKRAREENIAAFRLLPNHGLIALVKERPNNLERAGLSKIIHPSFLLKDSKEILKIVSGLEVDTFSFSKQLRVKNNFEKEDKQLIKKLKKWRNRVAEFRGIDISMVMNSKSLEIIANKSPKTLQELEGLKILSEWKLKHYGVNLIDIITGVYDGNLSDDLPKLLNK